MTENKCPFHKIEIPKNRKIIFCDELKFPWKSDKKKKSQNKKFAV
jgi:hypothetical protein